MSANRLLKFFWFVFFAAVVVSLPTRWTDEERIFFPDDFVKPTHAEKQYSKYSRNTEVV